jgi:hypothetical protein
MLTIAEKSAKNVNLAIWPNPLKLGNLQTPQGKKTTGYFIPRGKTKSTKTTSQVEKKPSTLSTLCIQSSLTLDSSKKIFLQAIQKVSTFVALQVEMCLKWPVLPGKLSNVLSFPVCVISLFVAG